MQCLEVMQYAAQLQLGVEAFVKVMKERYAWIRFQLVVVVVGAELLPRSARRVVSDCSDAIRRAKHGSVTVEWLRDTPSTSEAWHDTWGDLREWKRLFTSFVCTLGKVRTQAEQ